MKLKLKSNVHNETPICINKRCELRINARKVKNWKPDKMEYTSRLKSKGVKQKQIADNLGVSKPYISKLVKELLEKKLTKAIYI